MQPYLELQKTFFDGLKKTIINLTAIENTEIKKVLYSAEYLLQHLDEADELLDFSPSLIKYAQALEMILDDNLSQKIGELLRNDSTYVTIQEDGTPRITNIYFHGSKRQRIARLSHHISWIVCKRRSIPLGSWIQILREISTSSSNPMEQTFKDFLRDNLSDSQMGIIKTACETIVEHRNSTVHRSTRNKEQVMKVREEIISQINNVIGIFYKGTSV